MAANFAKPPEIAVAKGLTLASNGFPEPAASTGGIVNSASLKNCSIFNFGLNVLSHSPTSMS
jgi:hypothetical protein